MNAETHLPCQPDDEVTRLLLTVRPAAAVVAELAKYPVRLGPGEQTRHDRLRQSQDRANFLACRALAVRMLKGCPEPAAGFRTFQWCARCHRYGHGKPVAVGSCRSVSWSHSGRHVAVATGPPDGVAVDLEEVRYRSDGDRRTAAAALSVWTARECYVKLGLAVLSDVCELDADAMTARFPGVVVHSGYLIDYDAVCTIAIRRPARNGPVILELV